MGLLLRSDQIRLLKEAFKRTKNVARILCRTDERRTRPSNERGAGHAGVLQFVVIKFEIPRKRGKGITKKPGFDWLVGIKL